MLRNLPIPNDERIYSYKFYEECSEKIVRTFSSLPGIVSIYQFGNVRAPGNSDIDILFIVDDDAVDDDQNDQRTDDAHQDPVDGVHVTACDALCGPVELGFHRTGEDKADQKGWTRPFEPAQQNPQAAQREQGQEGVERR